MRNKRPCAVSFRNLPSFRSFNNLVHLCAIDPALPSFRNNNIEFRIVVYISLHNSMGVFPPKAFDGCCFASRSWSAIIPHFSDRRHSQSSIYVCDSVMRRRDKYLGSPSRIKHRQQNWLGDCIVPNNDLLSAGCAGVPPRSTLSLEIAVCLESLQAALLDIATKSPPPHIRNNHNAALSSPTQVELSINSLHVITTPM